MLMFISGKTDDSVLSLNVGDLFGDFKIVGDMGGAVWCWMEFVLSFCYPCLKLAANQFSTVAIWRAGDLLAVGVLKNGVHVSDISRDSASLTRCEIL